MNMIVRATFNTPLKSEGAGHAKNVQSAKKIAYEITSQRMMFNFPNNQ
jgi:hypothetical protein